MVHSKKYDQLSVLWACVCTKHCAFAREAGLEITNISLSHFCAGHRAVPSGRNSE